jgi:plastocyanin
MGSVRTLSLAAVAALACSVPLADAAGAQSLLERTPNMAGAWTGHGGQLHFHFVHRFSHSGAPERQVLNRPTFLLAADAPGGLLAGVRYATRSELATGVPNEWELFARARPFARARGAPADLGLQVGYNAAAASWDSELAASRPFGPLHAMLALRVLSSSAGEDRVVAGAAAGALFRLTPSLSLAADIGRGWSDALRDPVWSAGVHARLPGTPHTLSLHATNVSATTLHSAMRASDRVRWGFEFTVPVTPRRYLGGGAGRAQAPAAAGDTLVRVAMHNLQFQPQTLTVRRGTVVEWVNRDPLEHTVTAADGSWDSGPIAPEAVWRRRFDEPGTWAIVCLPHPFMRAEVVVQ